jgi:ABC-type nitrate/sulfonate/bicarbonate transport system substrate-binding protein
MVVPLGVGTRRAFVGSAVALGVSALGRPQRLRAADAKTTIRIPVNPDIYGYLPFMYGLDKGYFADEGLNVLPNRFTSSSLTQLPMLVNGQLDVGQGVPGPALYNQISEGWDIKAIASLTVAHAGWHDELWVMVRKDLWDSGAVRKLSDLRGRKIDAATPGAPINLLVNQMLVKAGLTRSDVIYSERLRNPADMITGLRNQAVDLCTTIEPTATYMVEGGYAMRFVSTQDIAPNTQTGFVLASAKYLADNGAAVTAFLRACMRARDEIVKGGPHAFPADVQKTLAAWQQRPLAEMAKLQPPYFEVGALRADSIEVPEDFWLSQGLLKTKVAAATMIDNSLIAAASKKH